MRYLVLHWSSDFMFLFGALSQVHFRQEGRLEIVLKKSQHFLVPVSHQYIPGFVFEDVGKLENRESITCERRFQMLF